MLTIYSWASNVSIPVSVITVLEKQWPNVKLIASNHHRIDTDIRLLSSTLLHSLTFGIFNWKTGPNVLEQYSRLPELKEVLLKSSQLRKLDIRTKYSWIGEKSPESEARLMNLPLDPSDRLPPLHELTFSGPDTYEFSIEHCQLLSQCLDWSKLRVLDLGLSCPQSFFQEMGGRLTSLSSLTMGIRTGSRKYSHSAYGPMTCNDYVPIKRFISSLPSLRQLCLMDLDAAAAEIAPLILEHQTLLQNLSYHVSQHRSHRRQRVVLAWPMTVLQNLPVRCPDLKCLEIDFQLEDGKWVSSSCGHRMT